MFSTASPELVRATIDERIRVAARRRTVRGLKRGRRGRRAGGDTPLDVGGPVPSGDPVPAV